MTMRLDLATRVADIRWPDGFDPHRADLFAHNALVIAAPCERVWRHHDLWLATLKWVAERADQ